jgi:hypothetical protein
MQHEVDSKILGLVVKLALEDGISKATKYLSPKLVVKAKRKLFGGKVASRSRIAEICVTVGAPNYAEREFIKEMKKMGVPFPIKDHQLKTIQR